MDRKKNPAWGLTVLTLAGVRFGSGSGVLALNLNLHLEVRFKQTENPNLNQMFGFGRFGFGFEPFLLYNNKKCYMLHVTLTHMSQVTALWACGQFSNHELQFRLHVLITGRNHEWQSPKPGHIHGNNCHVTSLEEDGDGYQVNSIYMCVYDVPYYLVVGYAIYKYWIISLLWPNATKKRFGFGTQCSGSLWPWTWTSIEVRVRWFSWTWTPNIRLGSGSNLVRKVRNLTPASLRLSPHILKFRQPADNNRSRCQHGQPHGSGFGVRSWWSH